MVRKRMKTYMSEVSKCILTIKFKKIQIRIYLPVERSQSRETYIVDCHHKPQLSQLHIHGYAYYVSE